MKEIDKKKTPNNSQAKRRDITKKTEESQQKNAKTMNRKENETNRVGIRPITSITGSDLSEMCETMVVRYEDDVNGLETRKDSVLSKDYNSEVIDHSSDLEKESEQGMEEISDSDARRNSVSSQGDFTTTKDDSITSKSTYNASEGSSRVINKSAKVVPKPSSETSEEIEDENFAHAEEYHDSRFSISARGVNSSDQTCDAEENGEQGEEQSIEEMEMRIDKLEEELREVAALEISLYSVVPEHGCSAHKVHTPARRLSRLYIHACKHWTQSRRATIAKNTVSGLVIIARSCGNDVPRLTFWLSNTVVLREIISQAFGNACYSRPGARSMESNDSSNKIEGKPSSLKWKGNYGSKQVNGNMEVTEDWQETGTFMEALVKVESWLFSRIVESVWWQSLTPNMQSRGDETTILNNCRRLLTSPLGDQQGGNFSIDLWRNAFQDAFQRLCPVRAAGHICGCLPVLARTVMEHCVARLDVAMFNAILRESAHEIPTDPVSDPIVDPNVLPIPAGDLSFGSGAQLKTSIGNWCRWLTETLGMDTRDSLEVKQHSEDYILQREECRRKSFVLLNSLSDLLMLPKDMLMDREIRKEICPCISLPLIKRILCNFTPDEFCPDPVPGAVLEVLNAENVVEPRLPQDPWRNFPYTAALVVYNPPTTADVAQKVAEAGRKTALEKNVSNIQRKGYTSDEELEELNSPLTSIIDNHLFISSSSNDGTEDHSEFISRNTRYELLQDVWSL